jgi:hypothetical protein
MLPSLVFQSKIDTNMESSKPTLNHAGELNASIPICPRKYFWATMLVAFCYWIAPNTATVRGVRGVDSGRT